MSRRLTALKPQLNRIRAWAHEGSTDAWIAHQLDTTAEAVRAFRQEHGIERGGPAPLAPITPDSVVEAMLAEEEAAAAAAELAAGGPSRAPEPEAARLRRGASACARVARAAPARAQACGGRPRRRRSLGRRPAGERCRRGGACTRLQQQPAPRHPRRSGPESAAATADRRGRRASRPQPRRTRSRRRRGRAGSQRHHAQARRASARSRPRRGTWPRGSPAAGQRAAARPRGDGRSGSSRSTGPTPDRCASRSARTRSSCGAAPRSAEPARSR